MLKITALIAKSLLSFLFVMNINAQVPKFYVRGDGQKTCAEYIEARRKNDIFEINTYLQYLQGFINGAELQRMWDKKSGIENATGLTVLLMAESICMQQPQNTLILVAAEITSKLVIK
jgi:hypothetical protein